MEEAPQGTFQDELEWCISQLETGLLRLNPTPEQEESQRILRVLRSRKAPFVKKRQVMCHVFGDYRLKMAQERKRAATAGVKSEKVQIQPGDASTSGSMVYRKQSSQPSKTSSWFTPSNNSFQFGFVIPERTPEEINRTIREAHEVGNSQEPSATNSSSPQKDQDGMLHFSTETQGPEFAFNFIIPNGLPSPAAAADPRLEDAAKTVPERDAPARKATELVGSSVSPNPDTLDTLSNRDKSVDDSSSLGAAQGAVTERKEITCKETNAAAAASGGSSKRRKKRKKQQPSKEEPSKNLSEDSRCRIKGTPDQTEVCQQSDAQVKREVDWCVEQLELGLKTQKATPKQMDEVLRAIRTLRSEKAVLAKKRQIMRVMFGDYRKKMAEERLKQLKLMQAASKAARITEVTEEACRKSSRVFRKSVQAVRRSQSPKQSLRCQPASTSLPRATAACPFTFTSSQEEFCFNFF
ncbi:UPF0488 protein C8orf33 homolog isoform X2 [Eublepharis macularius]|uniref:UPF0488 protein C8orf33 homolog isoform X2 n=1 Tax=Eublepharis macularius TaxID=481883 RepID=A0AA97K4I1_EUBMA|nr:UPF0488 protein C8orf33 homolog isoform X2 [Eublepharis macularius]